MEGGHFQQELFRKSKPEVSEAEKAKAEKLEKEIKDLYDEQQIKDVIEGLKNDGKERYPIMDIQEVVQKKVNFYKKLLFYVNIPLVFAIPLVCELGFFDHKPNVKTIYAFLHLTDFFLCFNSVIIYSTV